MEYGAIRGVREEGWPALEPRVMRPDCSDFERVLEAALALTQYEAKLVAKCRDESTEERSARWKRRMTGSPGATAIERIQEMKEKSRERRGRVEMRLARALPPTEAWKRLVPEEPRPIIERWFAGAVVQKGGAVSPEALHVPWGAWNVEREPTTLEPVLVLASDLDGMRAVETLAHEICRRVEAKPKRVTWFVEFEPRLVDFPAASNFRARDNDALLIPPKRLEDGEVVITSRDLPDDAWRFDWLRRAKRDLTRAHVWEEWAQRRRSGPNPYEPLLDVWRRGYAFLDVVGETIVLSASAPKMDELLDPLV